MVVTLHAYTYRSAEGCRATVMRQGAGGGCDRCCRSARDVAATGAVAARLFPRLMPATFLNGDLFHHDGLRAYAHGCNCAGAMGKGIAVEFKSRFPKMYAEYKKRCADGRFVLGDVFMWKEAGSTVFNLGTQTSWTTKAELAAVEGSVTKMVALAEEHEIARIGLPRIGAGLGGLSWPEVRAALERIGKATRVDLVVFEEFVPAKKPR
jgi:O-acetyl-ADP-ribose deacetylase (regulator of RNase III)